jgi:hypothetical protein
MVDGLDHVQPAMPRCGEERARDPFGDRIEFIEP